MQILSICSIQILYLDMNTELNELFVFVHKTQKNVLEFCMIYS